MDNIQLFFIDSDGMRYQLDSVIAIDNDSFDVFCVWSGCLDDFLSDKRNRSFTFINSVNELKDVLNTNILNKGVL